MKKIILFLVLPVALAACHPEDRSGEQPLPPTVRAVDCQIVADSCLMTGEVVASPNSRVRERGFRYGNDTLRLEVQSADTVALFQAYTQPLRPGRYFMVAYATNGVGTTTADTLWFVVP